MQQTQSLPRIKELQQFAYTIKNFPITGLGIVQSAEHMGSDDRVVDFVKLFSDRVVFFSRLQFMQTCRLLKKLIKEEVTAPRELQRKVED